MNFKACILDQDKLFITNYLHKSMMIMKLNNHNNFRVNISENDILTLSFSFIFIDENI